MSLFGNKSTKPVETDAKQSNIIGKGTVIKGDIEAFGVIRIDGQVIGNILAKSKVFLGQSAKLQGNMIAQNAEIEGEIKGDIKVAEVLTLKPTAIVNGNITASKMITDSGAVFNGQAKVGDTGVKGDITSMKHEQATPTPKPQQKPVV